MDLRKHLFDDVLAWWLTRGPDDQYGGVFTCWDNHGSRLLSTDKYTWSQGRWVWLLAATADAMRREPAPDGSAVTVERCLTEARSTARLLRAGAVQPDHSTVYVTDRTGAAFEPSPGSGLSTSVFADCFVALGFARLAQVDRDEELGALAELILLSAAGRIDDGTARTDPYPVHPAFASFALPMIQLGTATEVYQATGSDASAQMTADAVRTLVGRFRNADDRADLCEQPPRQDGFADTLLARHRAPGHALECLWFLVHAINAVPAAAQALTDAELGPEWICESARRSLALGWDDEHGGLLRYADADGGPPRGRLLDDPYERLVTETWDTKLWWPHAEALYTTALLSTTYGDADLSRWHERLARYTFSVFPAGPGQEWIQIRDRAGAPLDRTVALPVKDPFHIARALLLLIDLESPHRRPAA
ncbi:AGE family epimerase/isomerase [Phytoactinopolyspora halotolerans]|uniref:N-acylglucosamine 2-epimerase n=1 Tax=Phytoactinopolyspora halotolerans TaxID=1981512 RepID=A0A6L9SGE6_9ACTN|nr:AGE family epimerase/isomerase [Phytoactinopolyspora halotolerans]NEE04326.1 N-acylglucosamine 2-epimerase [Phytoactinopolyspora halotolerans]